MTNYASLLYSVAAALGIIIGVLVLIKDYRSRINIVFFLFCTSCVIWLIFTYIASADFSNDTQLSLVISRYVYAISILPVFFLALFFYYFPRINKKVHKLVWIITGIVSFFVMYMSAFTDLIERDIYSDNGIQRDILGNMYWSYLGIIVLLFIMGLYFLVRKINKVQGVEKSKLMIISIGFFITLFVIIMTNVVLPIFNVYFLQSESVAFSTVFFISVLYAIYKHRFFNFSYFLLNTLRGTLLILFYLAIFLGCFFISGYIFDSSNMISQIVFAGMIAHVSTSVFDQIVPSFRSSSFKHFEESLIRFESATFGCKTFEEFNNLLDNTFVGMLNLESVKVFLVTESYWKDGINVYLADEFTQIISREKDVIVTDELRTNIKNGAKMKLMYLKLRSMKAALCMPLNFQKKLIGFVVIGPKINKASFSDEEINVLMRIKNNLEVCFMNLIATHFLQEENNIMKKIVDEKTEKLLKNNMKLAKMIKQQEGFISLAAHEFRTPLTVARLGLEQIRSHHEMKLSQTALDDINRSNRQLDKLTTLVNRLLEMRKLEDDKMPLNREKFNLITFLDDIVKNMNMIASTKDIKIYLLKPRHKTIIINNDPVKLQQVLDNLLQNAIKFSPEKERIDVVLQVNSKTRRVTIGIKDNGVGIPEKDHSIIFDKFEQGGRYNQGVGIGLYLCKLYMKLIKGKIWVESGSPQGTTFFIEFLP